MATITYFSNPWGAEGPSEHTFDQTGAGQAYEGLLKALEGMQLGGKLLAASVIETGKVVAGTAVKLAKELASPCKALRNTWLNSDYTVTYATTGARPIVPYPVHEAPTTYGEWQEYLYRHYACEINCAAAEWPEQVHRAVGWFYDHLNGQLPHAHRLFEVSIPTLNWIQSTEWKTPEKMPALPVFSEDTVEEDPFAYCEVGIENLSVAQAWDSSKIPHTPMLLFVNQIGTMEATIFVAHTTPGLDLFLADGTRAPAGGEGKGKRKKGFTGKEDRTRLNLCLRLSKWVYRSTPSDGAARFTLSRTEKDASALKGDIQDIIANRANLHMHVARLDPFLMTEESLMAMSRLTEDRKQALTKPADYAHAHGITSGWNRAKKRAVYQGFRKLLKPFERHSLAPQQVHVLLVQFLQFYGHCIDSTAPFGILSIGGPPGTGKTATAALFFILCKSRKFLRGVVELFDTENVIEKKPDPGSNIDRFVKDRMIGQHVGFAATTNKAADEGLLTLVEHVEFLREQHRGDPSIVDDLPVPVRFSDYDKAQDSPETFAHHCLVVAAKERRALVNAELATILEAQNAAHQARRPYLQAWHEKVQMVKRTFTDEEWAEDGAKWEERYRLEALAEHPCLAENPPEQDRRKGQLTAQEAWLQKLEEHPMMFVRQDGRAPLKYISARDAPGETVAMLHTEAALVLGKERIIPFFTAGFANCYHDEIGKFCVGAYIVLDEASQATHLSLVNIVRNARAVALMGDRCQLGAVLKGDASAVPDLRIGILEQLKDSTIWLSLGLRVHPEVSDFLRTYVYPESYYHPTGQDVLRWSPLHAIELFRPVIILNVSGQQYHPPGSHSRVNDSEIRATALYLSLFQKQAGSLKVRGKSLAAISPYKAHSQALQQLLHDLPKEQDVLGDTISGSIETIEGKTVDITVLNLVCSRDGSGRLPNISFLDDKHINVAISRARYHLVVVADVDSIRQSQPHHLLRAFLEHFPVVDIPADPVAMRDELIRLACTSASGYIPPSLPGKACDAPALEEHESELESKGEGEFSYADLRQRLRSALLPRP